MRDNHDTAVHQKRRRSRLATVLSIIVTMAALSALPAAAASSTFGPTVWSNGSTSARYRANAGDHDIARLNACTGNSRQVELRRDVIDDPDTSYGTKFVECGPNNFRRWFGVGESVSSNYSGHFMQWKDSVAWSGRLRDTYPNP